MATTTVNSHHTRRGIFLMSGLAEKDQVGSSAAAPHLLGKA